MIEFIDNYYMLFFIVLSSIFSLIFILARNILIEKIILIEVFISLILYLFFVCSGFNGDMNNMILCGGLYYITNDFLKKARNDLES